MSLFIGSIWAADTAAYVINSNPVAPLPPNDDYSIPPGSVSVSTGAELAAALADGTPSDIVLEDGVYDNPTNFENPRHFVRARNLGAVILAAGMWMENDNRDPLLQGVIVDITDADKLCLGAYQIRISGNTGCHMSVLDCVLEGNDVAEYGIYATNTDGLVIQRIQPRNFRNTGVMVMNYPTDPTTQVIDTITDIDVAHCFATPRGSLGGTGEFGLWVGQPVTNPVARIKIRDCGWGGLWRGNVCSNTTFSDLDIRTGATDSDDTGTAIYDEHLTRNLTTERFTLGPSIGVGIDSEWDYGICAGLSEETQLPQATIVLNEPIGLSLLDSGIVYIGDPWDECEAVTYTGRTEDTLTGCSGGTGLWPAGKIVSGSWHEEEDAEPGGLGAWRNVYQDGTIDAPGGRPIIFDNGTMHPTVRRVTFLRAGSGWAILDRTNNPQCSDAAGSNLVTEENVHSGLIVPIVYGDGEWIIYYPQTAFRVPVSAPITLKLLRPGSQPIVLTRQAKALRYSTVMPGGFGSCDLELPGDFKRWAGEIPYRAILQVIDGMDVIFEGRVEDRGMSWNENGVATKVSVFGLQRRLSDASIMRVWLQRDIGWKTPSASASLASLTVGNIDSSDLTRIGVRFANDTGEALPGGWLARWVEFYRALPLGLFFTRLMAEVTVPAGGDHNAVLSWTGPGSSYGSGFIQYNGPLSKSPINVNFATDGGSPPGTDGTTPNEVAITGNFLNSPTGTEMIFENIRLLGTSLTEDVSGGMYGGKILADLVAQVTGISPGQIDTGSDFAIPSCSADTRRYVREIVDEICSYYTREWAIWEGGAFDWKQSALDEVQYIVHTADLLP